MKSLLSCLALLVLLHVQAIAQTPDLTQPIPELKLADGRVLHDVQIKAYNSKGVMVRHSGGVAQVNYESFPAPYLDAVLASKPKPEPAPAARAAAAAPARSTAGSQAAARQQVPARPYRGVVLARSGRAMHPLVDVEVRVYAYQYLARFDHERRASLPENHAEIRSRLNGKGSKGMPNMAEIEQFYRTEYDSWDSLLSTPFTARTNEKGEFDLYIPRDGDFALFARAVEEVGETRRYYVWAVQTRGEGVALNHENLYPALAE